MGNTDATGILAEMGRRRRFYTRQPWIGLNVYVTLITLVCATWLFWNVPGVLGKYAFPCTARVCRRLVRKQHCDRLWE